MATKFSTIYERAIFKFTDYSFVNLQTDFKEAILQKYLMSSAVEFRHACPVDLSDYDLKEEQFNNDLDDEMIEILAMGIAYHWLDAKVLNSMLLRNDKHNKNYVSYSPANLIKIMTELRSSIRKSYKGAINTYSFRMGEIENLKTGG